MQLAPLIALLSSVAIGLVPSASQDRWQEAEKAIVRLERSAFPELPAESRCSIVPLSMYVTVSNPRWG